MVLLAILGVVHSNAFSLFSSDTHRGWLRKLGAFAYVNMRRLYKPFGSQLHNLGERNAFLRAVTRRKPSYAFPIHLRVTSGHCGKQTQQKISQIQICRAYKIYRNSWALEQLWVGEITSSTKSPLAQVIGRTFQISLFATRKLVYGSLPWFMSFEMWHWVSSGCRGMA